MARWLILLFVCLFAQQADAEWYLGGQIGGVFPNTITRADVRSATLPAGTSFSNVDLENSIMVGGKAGYWFTKQGYEWLGLETNLQYANPDIAAQSIRTNLPTGFVFTAPAACVGLTSCAVPSNGADLRVLTWAPFIIKARYQSGPWQPYAGIGLGLFFAKTNVLGPSTSTTEPGLVTQLGMEYKLNDQLGLFGEWGYQHANLGFSSGSTTLSADYNAHVLAFGLNFHLPQ
jgi:opacity protein-like surface antigen